MKLSLNTVMAALRESMHLAGCLSITNRCPLEEKGGRGGA